MAVVAAGALVLCGGLAGCGHGSSDSPTGASKAAFCRTFTELGPETTPKEAAERLSKVGTPKGIDSGARHGFDVLVAHLRRLPDNAKDSDLTRMAQGLKPSDQKDVISFLTFYGDECGGIPSDSPS
jgi:hypothetical protein